MVTFLASTALHGFYFQVGAVLMSLGFFTYAETELRRKLANIFDASIEARRPTTPNNEYRYREGNFVVMAANMVFGLMTCVHLTYLGVMFDTSKTQEEGYNWRHTMQKWEELSFFSHIFMLLAYSVAFVL